MNFDKEIMDLAESMEPVLIERRRDLHRHPENGWTEFRTASLVITRLRQLGYEVQFGRDVLAESERMGVPAEPVLTAASERALREGAPQELVEKMSGGYTGVVGTLATGRPGKTVALRFDMDCNDVAEAADDKHRPAKAGFASEHKGCMHACGHDGHTSVGLGVAEILAKLQDRLTGKIKLIFQPAEEGVRGARAMAAKGVVDDADYLIGSHFMMPKVGFLAYDVQNFLATSKLNVDFTGLAAHAGGAPEQGKNALLAAAAAALNLHAITRHSAGSSRINVGVLKAGTGRNVVPATAHMEIETRGATTEINDFVRQRAEQVIKGAAQMYDVAVRITPMGSAPGGNNSPGLAEKIRSTAARLGIFDEITDTYDMCGSEDFTYFMERMQKQGKQAAYIIVGGSLAAINHNDRFDFDEHAMVLSASLLATAAVDLLQD
ncbi:amidohydrolase [Selenomonas sp. AE3005]|uniref:amidohydrolase n=1 Tax=Selenomonas sp. AE3005 TaxID=1485543 RepID=UPI0004878961|nr:amidohydrolase [Selenomonas sp. AE3005]